MKIEEGSWVRRWTYCWRCKKITPHVPRLFEWSPASPKCEVCGNMNSFRDFRDVDCEMMKLLVN